MPWRVQERERLLAARHSHLCQPHPHPCQHVAQSERPAVVRHAITSWMTAGWDMQPPAGIQTISCIQKASGGVMAKEQSDHGSLEEPPALEQR